MNAIISEFEPNPAGQDPTDVMFELAGMPGETFSGWILSIENDGANGLVDRAAMVSGTFDANGLLVVTVPDLENPSFTVVLTDSFTGTIGSTDIDTNDDGVADDLSALGTIHDALGVPDSSGDEATLYGAQLGGTDFAFTGDEPGLVFRAASTGDWYAVNEPAGGQVFDVTGTDVTPAIFDTDPTAGPTFGAVNPSPVFTLELLHIADQEPLNAGATIADIPRLSAVLNALRDQDLGGDGLPDNTLTLSSGDAIIPGLFYDASEVVFGSAGIADIQIQNELGIEAIAFGNHEFDFGTADLAALIDGSAPGDFSALSGTAIDGTDFAGTAFPYLSANLDFSADPNMAPLDVAGGQAPQGNVVTSSTVITEGGEEIGVVGATTPTLASISSPGSVGISPAPFDSTPTPAQLDALAAEIQTEVDALLAANPAMNKVVLLSHMQRFDIELALAERLSGVDIIVGGGSNTRLFDDNDRIRDGDSDQGQYPQFVTDVDGNTTAVVNTDGSYKYVGRLVIDFDAAGNVIPGSYDENVSGAYATDQQGVDDLAAAGLIDPEIQAIVDAVEAQIIATESNVFGVSDVFLNGNRSGGPTDGVRTQETNLGNLTADANLAAAQDSDPSVVISLKNGGGIRASIGETIVPAGGTEPVRSPNQELVDGDGNVVKPEGGISQNDIQTVLAFNNGLVLMTLTAEEIVGLLEHGIDALPGVSGQFPQVAGVKFSFDETQPSGSKVLNAGIFDENGDLVAELVRDGSIVDPSAEYRIVTLDFLSAPRFTSDDPMTPEDESGVFIGAGDGYPFPNTNTDPSVGEVGDPAVIARVDKVFLEQGGVQTGDATFADDGTEQDALAEYLDDNFNPDNGGTAYGETDTVPDLDERIQNVAFREDTVLPADGTFTLELLHFTDQEANASTIGNIDNLSAVLNALRDEDLGGDGLPDNTLTLSSGDAIIPGLFFDASEAVFGSAGIADIQIQNELGVQAISFGNHEFDLGTAFIAGLIDGTAPGDFSALSGTALDGLDFTGTAFPYLSTNLDFSTDPNLAPLEVPGGQDTATLQNVVTSSSVSDVNGELVGIVGATVPTIRSISSAGDDIGITPEPFDVNPSDGLDATEEAQLAALAAEIQMEVDALLAANPDMDKVILLSHMQQIDIEFELAQRLENVDIIVAGGSNTRLFDDNDRIRDGDSDQGQYPQFFTNAGGTETAVVNTDAQYKYVGRLVIDFDADGNIVPASYDEDVSGAYATDDQGVTDLGAAGLIDPEIDAITDAIQAQIVATESNVFGVSDVFLNGNRSGTFTADDPDGVRTQETNLGNLTADANLDYANQMIAAEGLGDPVVVSIKNGGGIRANIGDIVVPAGGSEAVRLPNEAVVDENGNVVKPEGGISQNDIASTLAFNNGLTLLDVTKAELVATLEGAVGSYPGVSGGFPQIAGVKFSFDPSLPDGDRIISAGIFDEDGNLVSELVRDGEIVGDETEVFRVVTLDFLANSGDPVLSNLSNPNRVDLIDLDADGADDGLLTGAATFAQDGTEQDALAEYLDENFNPDNGGTAYDEADTGPADDERIQNLDFRADTVFPDFGAPAGTGALKATEVVVLDSLAGEGGAEVVDHQNGLLYVTNGALGGIDVWDIATGTLADFYDLSGLPGFDSVQSVAVFGTIAAAAVATPDVVDPVTGDVEGGQGYVALIDTGTGMVFDRVPVGVLPDAVAFTPDGQKLLVANEGEFTGESDLTVDPVGSISVIDLSNPIFPSSVELDFSAFVGMEDDLRAEGVRLAPGVSALTGFEPEYITVTPDGTIAVVTLQEANAVAVVDLVTMQITDVVGLGTQDHSIAALDPNDDGMISIDTYENLVGMRMPDAIANYEAHGSIYYVTANEGDGRGDPTDDLDDVPFPDRADEARLGDILDGDVPGVSIDPSIDTAGLERLTISLVDGDTDGDGDIDVLHSFGARSFTIFDQDGNVVFDSGDDFERIIAERAPERFNNDDGEPIATEDDNRSDAKGPEPEAVAIGEVDGRTYAFIGLERDSGIMIYDVTVPEHSFFVNYVEPDFVNVGGGTRHAPEVIEFIPADQSTTGTPQIAVAYEVSGTTVVFDLEFCLTGPQANKDVYTTTAVSDIDGLIRGNVLMNDKLFDMGVEVDPSALQVVSFDGAAPGTNITVTTALGGEVLVSHAPTGNGNGVQFAALPMSGFDTLEVGETDIASFTYTISDGNGNTAKSKVKIVLEGTADPQPTFDLQITEIFPGQQGDDLTEDWFEITNKGPVAYTTADGPLFYDDESEDPLAADEIFGIGDIGAGESVIVVVGDQADAAAFETVWGPSIDLTNVQVGWTDGAGLSQNGDAVTLFLDGDMDGAEADEIVDVEAFPAQVTDGASYDVPLAAESVAGNAAGAVETLALGGDNADTPNIGSPGYTDMSPFAPPPTTFIGEIQGAGNATPFPGQTFTIEGVVTASFQDGDELGGFFVEQGTPLGLFAGDGSAMTSDGIFVEWTNSTVAEGDTVRVTGVAEEFFGRTQLDATSVTVTGSGFAVDSFATVVDPTFTDAEFEALEGMRVAVFEDADNPLTGAVSVTETFNLGRFGEFEIAPEVNVQPTQVIDPGQPGSDAAIQALADKNLEERITINDGRSDQNPPVKVLIDDGAEVGNVDGAYDVADNPGPTLRVGAEFAQINGVLDFSFGDWTAQYDFDVDGPLTPDAGTNDRPGLPEVGGEIQVASYNVLNFFTSIDGIDMTPSGAGERGADSAAEFARQLEKTVTGIRALDAEIVGLQEIENNGFGAGSAISTLVDGLNAAEGASVWSFVDYSAFTTNIGGVDILGSDAITTGIIYRNDAVDLIGEAALIFAEQSSTDTEINTGLADLQRNRPATAATFEDANGGKFTLVNNHFKSKGDSGLDAFEATPGLDPNIDQGDGQGYWNEVRREAAEELVDWIATDPTGSGDDDVLVIGDLNAYGLEDPIDEFVDAGYAHILGGAPTDYSFTFFGAQGALDHTLASDTMASQITGADEWHVNADEPRFLDYNQDFEDPAFFDPTSPFRASDHDPAIIGLSLQSDAVTDEPMDLDGGRRADVLEGGEADDDIDGGNGGDLLIGNGGNDAIDGGNGADEIDGGDGDDEIFGGNGSDLIMGGDGADDIEGGNGADEIYGGAGGDVIDGGNRDDEIYGDEGDDVILGGNGRDVIEGGEGDDVMDGGNAMDTFIFDGMFGDDTILNYENGMDELVFLGASLSALTIAEVAGSVEISINTAADQGSVTLDGQDLASFDQSLIFFA